MAEKDSAILNELRDIKIEIEVLKRSSVSDDAKEDKEKPLYKSLAEIIAIIAVVAGIFYTISQTIGEFAGAEKTGIDAELSLLEIQEKRLQIQKTINELAENSGQELLDRGEEARALLSDIDQTLAELSNAESAFRVDDMVTKFIFLWASFVFIGLVSEVVNIVWSSFVGSLISFFHRLSYDARKNMPKLLSNFIMFGQVLLMMLPNIFFLVIKFSLFTAVVAPFLIRIAMLNPSEPILREFLDSLTSYKFWEAIQKLSQLFT